ncbi:lipopolysaccharide biosynthesis protein RfbH [Leptospira ilyithenensis]|uniref:Lipopolysaccharide biosynthesis protein RfbH n=2 Tax=Leptospira ilyithenensis TaxID=2484901 RepID=A0A4R9LQQ1_9LEPT|nr:lipopolysaccharide biosynthesis protein RfbH [Leptospira ilyithenensis]
MDRTFREIIKGNTISHFNSYHKKNIDQPFVEGSSRVSYAGRVFDEKEVVNLVDSSLDFWLTTGRYAEEFEKTFSKFIGTRHTLLVNSGSSANLIAFSALTSPSLKDRQIKKGDEVIGVAAGFPTTINPILQYGAVPVLVDISLPTYNIDVNLLEQALSPKTKAVMIAHSLGNPFDLQTVKDFCTKHNLWLVEDNCDALGSRYYYNGEWKYTGTVGDIATSSFYPPHHMTMGEGGAVYMQGNRLKKIAESYRDWGRDCWCPSGKDNTCGKRFNWELGELPHAYDHKYIYSHLGYNLKVTDMQAAIGVAQLKKLPDFIKARRKNWQRLRDGLADLEEFFVLPEPTRNSEPSWFGFLLTVKDNAKFSRKEIVEYLEEKRIQTRMLFAGNYLRHPVFDEFRGTSAYRVAGSLENTDRVMNHTFWLGVYPGMSDMIVDYMIEKIREFIKK